MRSLKHFQPTDWNIKLNERQYDAEINRKRPSAILFMIDQSASMGFENQIYKGVEKSFNVIVAEMINEMLNELIGRCTKSEGVRDYFDVCVIGYGGLPDKFTYTLWEGDLIDKDWVSISELKENAIYKKVTVIKTIRGKSKTAEIDEPYWFQPVANYQTPMRAAFNKVHELISDWIINLKHENSYPPVVINITDGMQTDSSDEELIESAQKVQALNTKDGHVLILNCHISSNPDRVIFPLAHDELPRDNYSKMLFDMSSVMPQIYNEDIANFRNDPDILSNYRGMAFNANMDVLFNLIDIGTSGSTQHLSKG